MELIRSAATPLVQPPEELATEDDRSVRRLGLIIVLVVFVGFGAWAAIAPLSSAARAPGVISVEGYRKTVQHLEGGIVRTIHVRDGQSVAKSEVLLTLDDTQPRAQFQLLRGQLFIALSREAGLIALRDRAEAVKFGEELLQSQADSRAQQAMHMQEQAFRARLAAHNGEIGLYRQQIGQLQARAAGLQAQQAGRVRLVGSYEEELDDFEALVEEGYAEKQKVRELERNLAFSEGQAGELAASLAATELQTSETRLKILQLHKELQQEVAKELGEVQAELFSLREELQSVQDTVTRTVVRAPQAGTVLGLSVHTVGAVVRPGDRLLDIVPQDERLIIEAKLAPTDIDRVHIGQLAEVRFSAFKTRNTLKIDARLVALSADRLIDESDQLRVPYYLARVEIPQSALEKLRRRGLVLVAGMPAEVLINTGERTLLGYLVRPVEDSFARAFLEE